VDWNRNDGCEFLLMHAPRCRRVLWPARGGSKDKRIVDLKAGPTRCQENIFSGTMWRILKNCSNSARYQEAHVTFADKMNRADLLIVQQ
jgi:hypothetical protein